MGICVLSSLILCFSAVFSLFSSFLEVICPDCSWFTFKIQHGRQKFAYVSSFLCFCVDLSLFSSFLELLLSCSPLQVRHALVLSAPPPSLVLDGAGRAGEACIAGGGEVASVLLSLPRPFQVSPGGVVKLVDFTKFA